MRRFTGYLIAIVLAVALSGGMASARKRQVDTAKKERQASQQKVNETKRKIKANEAETRRNLNQLNKLNGEISAKTEEIAGTQASIDSLDRKISVATDTLEMLDGKLKELNDTYAHALRKLQGTKVMTNELGYIFSSETFARSMARVRYVREFAQWRKRQVRNITDARKAVDDQRAYLASLQTDRQTSLDALNSDRRQLQQKQAETDKVVSKLKTDRAALQKALKAEQKRLRQIDNEISRMIADDNNSGSRGKSSKNSGKNSGSSSSGGKTGGTSSTIREVNDADPDKALTEKFAANKGKMLFPVAGQYTIARRYGRITDETTGLQTTNTGIELTTPSAANARAVFEGKVSRIYQSREGPYAIMLRHGAYITVYYNIASPAVKVNDKVSAGQNLGSLAADPHYDNLPMLHFEVRKVSTTYDPLKWVK